MQPNYPQPAPNQIPALSQNNRDLLQKFGQALSSNCDADELLRTLVRMTFDGRPMSNEQLAAFLLVANEYKLNPFLKEIYAFPGKAGPVPMVGYDGWVRLMNNNPNFDGVRTEEIFEGGKIFAVRATIWRKDRREPTVITEYLAECDTGTPPWRKYPVRMLRNKAVIQCVRLAFGYGGIYDEDEAARIDAAQSERAPVIDAAGPGPVEALPERKPMPDELFSNWLQKAQEKRPDFAVVEASVHARHYCLTPEQAEALRAACAGESKPEAPAEAPAAQPEPEPATLPDDATFGRWLNYACAGDIEAEALRRLLNERNINFTAEQLAALDEACARAQKQKPEAAHENP